MNGWASNNRKPLKTRKSHSENKGGAPVPAFALGQKTLSLRSVQVSLDYRGDAP